MTFRSLILGAGLLAVALASGAQTAARKPYIVQLADAPAAVYTGTLSGLAATRPAPGVKFDAGLPSVRAYVNYLNVRQSTALARVGSPPLLHSYNLAFNGFAASLTDAEAKSLKTSIDVVSVTPSRMLRIVTTTSPTFLGLTAPGGLWSQLDAQSRQVKGEDVIIGLRRAPVEVEGHLSDRPGLHRGDVQQQVDRRPVPCRRLSGRPRNPRPARVRLAA